MFYDRHIECVQMVIENFVNPQVICPAIALKLADTFVDINDMHSRMN